MERFVQFIALGGTGLVAALWLTSVSGVGSVPWALGVVLAVLGTVGLLYGTGTRIERVRSS